jgi:NAD(P)H-flavin reductase
MTGVAEKKAPARAFPMVPRPFRVVANRRQTADTVTLTLAPEDAQPLAFAAGQFAMLGAFGAGEAPISISGDPAQQDLLEHTIRDVGGVTRVLCGAAPGDLLTVRGPYGTGWDVRDGIGGDVVIVAGGIGLAPLRPAIVEVLANRDAYDRVVVMYGARSPGERLFLGDLDDWLRSPGDIHAFITVDQAGGDWHGRVGLVTSLIPMARFDPERTLALVCGPEVMMRFTAAALMDSGVSADRIRVSLERNMECGIGLCGHCQLRELFICTDGPVFSYDRVAGLMTLREY